jgi:imidazolonepropionase
MAELVHNIGMLVTLDGEDGHDLAALRQAAVVLDGERIAWIGPTSEAPASDTSVDAEGACVIPGFVDSHTHLVFAGDRSVEFEARSSGRPYTAGGIRTTVEATRQATAADLDRHLRRLLDEALRSGTTTIEIKSGYGLTVDDERRALQLAVRYTPETTFLGAHVVPPEFQSDERRYVDLVAGAMLDAAVPFARWIDAFCEVGAFDVAACRRVLAAGAVRGLGVRLHANQLGHSGGVALGVELGAASVDHCSHLSDADVEALASSDTVATFVPAAEFSTGQPFPPFGRLRDAGVQVAIATDCNPGSSYTTSMPFCIALAVSRMGMTPAEALHAATKGGARALRRDDVGVIRVGARADLVLLDAPNPTYLAYRPGVNLVRSVWRGGIRSRTWRPDDAA